MKLIPRSGRRTVICAAGLAMALVFPLYAFAGDAPEWLSPRLRDHPLAGAIVNAQGEKVPESITGSECLITPQVPSGGMTSRI